MVGGEGGFLEKKPSDEPSAKKKCPKRECGLFVFKKGQKR